MAPYEIYLAIGAFFGYFNGLMFINDFKSKHFELRPPYPSFQHRGMAAVKLGIIFILAASITALIWPGYLVFDVILPKILKRKGSTK